MVGINYSTFGQLTLVWTTRKDKLGTYTCLSVYVHVRLNVGVQYMTK